MKQAACRTYQVLQGNIDILLPGAFTLCRRPGHCHDALSLLQLPSAMHTRTKHIAEAHLHVCLYSCTVALCMMLLFELLAIICRCLQDPCTSCALLCTACKPCRVLVIVCRRPWRCASLSRLLSCKAWSVHDLDCITCQYHLSV